MFGVPCDKCLSLTEEKLQLLLETDTQSKVQQNGSGVQSFEPSELSQHTSSPVAANASGYKIKKYEDSTTAGPSLHDKHSGLSKSIKS